MTVKIALYLGALKTFVPPPKWAIRNKSARKNQVLDTRFESFPTRLMSYFTRFMSFLLVSCFRVYAWPGPGQGAGPGTRASGGPKCFGATPSTGPAPSPSTHSACTQQSPYNLILIYMNFDGIEIF